jgi:hypothetical protein
MESTLPQGSPQIAQALNSLAATYEKERLFDRAETLNKRSLAILEGSSSPNYPMLIESLKSYALILCKTGRSIEAEPFETRAMIYEARYKEMTRDHQ